MMKVYAGKLSVIRDKGRGEGEAGEGEGEGEEEEGEGEGEGEGEEEEGEGEGEGEGEAEGTLCVNVCTVDKPTMGNSLTILFRLRLFSQTSLSSFIPISSPSPWLFSPPTSPPLSPCFLSPPSPSPSPLSHLMSPPMRPVITLCVVWSVFSS